jgi:hypothetical protein
MLNQVEFEGYLTRSWEYREQRFMRLANHRPAEDGKPPLGLRDRPDRPGARPGCPPDQDRPAVRLAGRIVGRDIVEPVRLEVGKSHAGVELPTWATRLNRPAPPPRADQGSGSDRTLPRAPPR